MAEDTVASKKREARAGEGGGHFRRNFFLYLLVLFFVASAVLITFYFALQSYERSQPGRAVENFLASLSDDETALRVLEGCPAIAGNDFEPRERLLREGYLAALREGTLTYGRDFAAERAAGLSESTAAIAVDEGAEIARSSGDLGSSGAVGDAGDTAPSESFADVASGTSGDAASGVGGEADPDKEIYSVYRGEEAVFSLTLARTPRGAGFFLDSWEVSSVRTHPEGFGLDEYTARVMVPVGASLTVNGVLPAEDQVDRGVPLCLFEEDGIAADVYTVEGLHLTPDLAVATTSDDGESVPLSLDEQVSKDGERIFAYLLGEEKSETHDYTITAPAGVEVFLNDILLTRSSCFSYEDGVYPEDAPGERAYGTPETIVYRARYFRREPSIAASYAGIALTPLREEGGEIVFAYPEEALISLRIEVPPGAVVRAGEGDPLPRESAATEQMSAFGLSEYAEKMDHPPQTTVYRLERLLRRPTLSVELDGRELTPAEEEAEGEGARDIRVSYLAQPDESLLEEKHETAEAFVRAYLTYVGMGKKSLDSNLERLRGLTLPGSEAEKTVRSAYDELLWVNAFKEMEENYLTTSDFIPLSEDCFLCRAAFSVDIRRSNVEKHFESEMTLLFVRAGGKDRVAEFRFE